MRAQTQTLAKADTELLQYAVLASTLALAVYILIIFPAMATPTPMGDVLCAIWDMIHGNLGRGLATLAIVVVGVGATLGKVSWGLAITVAVGISVIFNANDIAGMLGSSIGGC